MLRCSFFAVWFCVLLGTTARADCVAVIPAGADHQFWRELIAGAKAAAADENIDPYVRAPSTEDNSLAQELILDAALKDGCKGVLLAPNTPDVVSHVARIARSGIPVVYVDRDMGGARVSTVKTNNYYAGTLAAQEMIRLLEGKGSVALLRMRRGVRSTSEREAGFRDTILASGITISRDVYIGSTVGEARENTLLLMKSGLDADGIFTPNESTTVGAMVSRKQFKDSKPVHHIGFDYTAILGDALKSGHLSGLVVQQPYQMGYEGVRTLLKAMRGEPFAPTVDVPVFFIDADGSEKIEPQVLGKNDDEEAS
jgi:ribose transport system substrate-binding protein